MKTSLQTLISNTFKDKIFKGSEFPEPDDNLCTIYGEDGPLTKEVIGKKIINADVYHLSEGDCGIGLKFEGLDDTFFFWHNCDLEVE